MANIRKPIVVTIEVVDEKQLTVPFVSGLRKPAKFVTRPIPAEKPTHW